MVVYIIGQNYFTFIILLPAELNGGACESKQYTGKAPNKKRLIQLDGRRIVMVAHTGSHLGVFTGSERKNDGAFFP